MRRLARELGLDLSALSGTGPKGRITKEDVIAGVRGPRRPRRTPAGVAAGGGIPEVPAQDFSKFGPVEVQPLSRIQRLSGPALHRSWLNVPHVTHDDEADITDLDAYRRELDAAAKAEGYRVTLLAFLMKASVSALREFPRFNSSLTPEKDALIYKSYYHLGVAVDTPEGLVVPVIRDVDRKGITELSRELGAVSAKAGTASWTWPTCRAPASRSPAWAASAGPASRPSSTPPRWRSSAWSGPGPRRSGTVRRSCRG